MASGMVSRLVLLVVVQFAVVYGAQFEGAPDITEGATRPPKEGTCPSMKTGGECPPEDKVVNECLVDFDCKGDKKCCSDGCSFKCLAPVFDVSATKCKVPIDLGFLIDASGSIGTSGFDKIKNFVKKIIEAFEVSDIGTHVSAVWYSDDAKVAFDFNKLKGKDINTTNVFKLVESISVTKGKTRIDKALRLAYSDVFSDKGGSQPGRPKILLVLTDGRQTREPDVSDAEDLHVASKPLKESGVQVYSLGIGQDIDIGELLDIASDDESVFSARDFDDLQTIVASITKQTCKGCTRGVDIHFAIDSSTKVSKTDFDLIRSFLTTTLDRFVISPKGAHFSGSVFADDAKLLFNFHQGSTKDEVLKKIYDMPQLLQGESNMDKAARLAATDAFSLEGGTRQGTPKVFLLLTAGNCSSCKERLRDAVAPLENDGVQIIIIAIGNKIDLTELQTASSKPLKRNLFVQDSVLQLPNPILIQKISEAICRGHSGVCPVVRRPPTCPPLITYTCESDIDCKQDQRCCFDGCGKACVSKKLGCIKPLDVAFAIDVSSNNSPIDFKLLKDGTSKMMSDFKVGAANSHIGLLTFSSSARVIYNFARTYDPNKMKKELNVLSQDAAADTDLGVLLKTADNDMFSLKGRARRGVGKVLILVTRGPLKAKDTESILKNAEALKQSLGGVELISVYIGPKGSSDAALLKQISSQSQSSKQKKFFQFNSLADFIKNENLLKISTQACSASFPNQCPVMPKLNACLQRDNQCEANFDCPGNYICCPDDCRTRCIPKSNVCAEKLDLMIALDDSNKVGEKDFLKVRNFAKKLLSSFKLDDGSTRVAAMSYSSKANLAFGLGKTKGSSLKEMQTLMQAIPYTGKSESRLDKAFDLATQQLLLIGRQGANIKKTLLLFTDGNSAVDSKRLDIASWPLRARNVRIVAVAVGNNINEKRLNDTVSLPISENVFLAANYDDLQKNINEITKMSCKPAQIRPDPPVQVIPGPPGDPGPKGDPGRPGEKGDKGPTGQIGDQGLFGDIGGRGAKGDRGAAGPPGPAGGITKGPDPLYSAVGILSDESGVNPSYNVVPGSEGPQGSPGSAGPVGGAGDKGEPGEQGPKGAIGRVGPYGPQGPRGKDGLNGNKGQPGDPGDKGPQGPVGPVGPPGRPGAQGPFGWKGVRGPQGAAGDQGAAGAAGLKGYPGEKGAQGEVGETGAPGTVGEVGPTGPQGQRGARGKQGAPGKQGVVGEEGFVGSTGLPGIAGAKGASGAPGIRGPKGAPGEVGLPGAQGLRGISGNAGTPGKEGAPGKKGTPGATGSAGAQGLTGPEGPQGPQGLQGLIGAEGPKGDSGQRGQRGPAGIKGDEGDPGSRGAQGPQGADGPQGGRGTPGQKGTTGPTGESGPRGRDGDPGVNGAQGIKGEPGEIGNVGRQGQKGSRGHPGVVGDQGSAGPVGQAGAPGQAGKDGKQGATGPSGKDGSPGSPGATGQQGFPGPVGPPGAVGDTGNQGKRGADGKNGRKGVAGEPGPVGETGFQGPQGETGPIGEVGPQGAPGVSGLQGSQGPTGKEGLPGKNGAKGPKGSAGKDGPPGPQGERGAEGLRGATGLAGRQGAPGEEGDRGDQGPRGNRGANGPAGEQGAQGPPGPLGQPGTSGRRGARGPDGKKGPKGEAGSNGLPGSPGMQGLPGRQGAQGQRGERGADGPSGAPGLDGIIGEPGETGPPGLPGRNGAQGLPGPSGPPGDRGAKGQSGDPGEKGATGRPGATGTVGAIGRRGRKGQRGEIGEIGETGERGPQGPIGPSGQPGATGPPGLPGPPGPSGKDGKRGPRGDTGEPGSRGPQGQEGNAGKDGLPGNPGKSGKAGDIGAPGPRGPIGNRGPAGLVGSPGPMGRQGPPGAKGYQGLNGRDGSNAKQGPQGRTGPQGPPGAIGDPGLSGSDGAPGISGLPGSNGEQGPKGSRGDSGLPGAPGSEGSPGKEGPQGPPGEKGYTGKSGKEGKPGAKGDAGDSGDVGTAGTAGADGTAGRKGLKGNQGANGIPGAPGNEGDKGDKGYRGVQGPPGRPGARGSDGEAGLKGYKGRPGPPGLDGSKGNDGEYGDPGDHGKPGAPGPPGPTGPAGPPGEMMPMSGQFAGYLTAGGLQKGPAYGGYHHYGYRRYSGKLGTEETKAVDKNVNSFNELLKLIERIEGTKSYRGEQNNPARTCRDLFMSYPSKKSGDYWIDPNEGSSIDKVLVYCDKNTSSTCIYPKHPTLEKKQWLVGGDKYKWVMQQLQGEVEGVLYAAELRQIKVMKLLSTRVQQTVTYLCKNSHAWKKASGKFIHKTVKFLTDNENEVHGHSFDAEVMPEVHDGCKMKDGKWHETIFKFDTRNLDVLPILDIAAHDIGDNNEQFGLKIGPVCFS